MTRFSMVLLLLAAAVLVAVPTHAQDDVATPAADATEQPVDDVPEAVDTDTPAENLDAGVIEVGVDPAPEAV